MGVMADRLDDMVIRVSSPDGRFEAVYRDRDGLDLQFRDGGYRDYTERELERQLTQVVNRLRAGIRRGFDAALSAALGMSIERPKEVADANRRRYLAERAATAMEGMSDGGWIYACHTGGNDWRVVLRDGVLSELDEIGFGAEVASAHHNAWRDCAVKSAGLREKHFGTRIAASSRPSTRNQRREEYPT